jgi:NAD+ kinase
VYNKIYVVPKIGGANIVRSHELILEMKDQLKEFYSDHDLKIIESSSDIDENTIAVPVGGDGTVLYVAKLLAQMNIDIPIIGFNLGQLGFLTDLKAESIFITALFDTILDLDTRYNMGPFKEDLRTFLSVSDDAGHEYLALNDFVISNLYADCIIKYDLSIGESYAGHHKANGVIIATPTGSTAYAMNLGGAIIEPDLDVIEIVNIAGMGMSQRPILVSGKSEITVKVAGSPHRTVSCKADGQEVGRFDSCDVNITIVRHEKKARLLHMDNWNFFEKLTDKLNWNA